MIIFCGQVTSGLPDSKSSLLPGLTMPPVRCYPDWDLARSTTALSFT